MNNALTVTEISSFCLIIKKNENKTGVTRSTVLIVCHVYAYAELLFAEKMLKILVALQFTKMSHFCFEK